MIATLLQASSITKSYAGIQALKNASLEVRAGEVHALIGENGAGKSTLIKIMTGAVSADSGELKVNGRLITDNSTRLAKSLGIVAIYQQPALFPELTVAENISLGLEQAGRMWKRVNWRERRGRAAELLARIGAKIDPEWEAGDLTMPQQQLVEIARALGAKARVLILDEPTASLSEEDTQKLFLVIGQLRASGAVGMIYISHRLEELPVIADRVTVLRDGSTIGTHTMSEVNRQQLIQLMVGRDLSSVFPKRKVALGDVALSLSGLGCTESGIRDVNLTVRAGEIVGLAGLVGAGRTELARIIFGLTPADSGKILLRNVPVKINNPLQAIEAGIAYVPEDRRRHGVIPDLPISANITLASLEHLTRRGGRLDLREEKKRAADYTRRLGIKAPSIFASVSTLSGGNQQKVALSRWLMTKPSVLILDEPTQGIDVGAKSEIHALMTDLAAEGVAVLMISSEMSEMLNMSDRIAVMHGGTIVRVVDRARRNGDARRNSRAGARPPYP
ncbi:MAG: sugar ABC transporter ATP-binding protein [Pyrinomonadaceae bacterium]